MEDSFLSLPFEIQERVISQRSDLILIFSQVNTEYYSLLKHRYYNYYGNRSLSVNGINTDLHPTIGIIYAKYLDCDENNCPTRLGLLITIFEKNKIPRSIQIVIDNVNGVKIHRIKNKYVFKHMEYLTEFETDLLLTYNLYLKRLSCMTINPNYAKNKCLEILNKQLENYNKIIDKEIDFEYKCYIIYIYSYAIVNKFIFGISDNSKLRKLRNIEGNIEDIKHDIEYIFNTVWNEISNI
jgi:hypothetical protein